MPVPRAPVGALLFVSGPADVAWFVVAVVVDAVDCHVFGARTKFSKPLIERLEAKLDTTVGAVVVGLTAPLGFSVAAIGALVNRIYLNP